VVPCQGAVASLSPVCRRERVVWGRPDVCCASPSVVADTGLRSPVDVVVVEISRIGGEPCSPCSPADTEVQAWSTLGFRRGRLLASHPLRKVGTMSTNIGLKWTWVRYSEP
jgi:hypothetical protein